ncbi:MAG: CAP domain-containing protein [Polyangiaceae bacterium]
MALEARSIAISRRYARAAVTSLALCGALAGCASSGSAPPSPSHPKPAEPNDSAPNRGFADVTESPQVPRESSLDPDERTLNAACGESDAALLGVARHLAEQQTDTSRELDVDAISYALRAAGAPYVWPRAWLFSGSEGEVEAAKARMQRWLGSFSDGGARRCGVSLVHQAGKRISVGAVAVDALADLAPLPTRVRIGQWLELRASLRVPASEAKLVVMGPRGAPHPVPTSFSDGKVHARFNADQAGAWVVQLLGTVDGGPRPLLEALLFAGGEPPRGPSIARAPGEERARAAGDPRSALFEMVNAAREAERLTALEPDERLTALAQSHAEAMRRAHKTAHDAGDGDLNFRLEQLGLELEAGENVAHAGSAVLAQRALWASPSHRENLLFARFDLLGIGVAPDPDGTLWVCQVFGNAHSATR